MVRPLVITNDMPQEGDPKQEIVRAWREAEVNVRAFGATGDGVTDDTAAILEAVRVASLAAGHVVFPPGTYKLTQQIDVNADFLTLEGRGMANLTFNIAGYAIRLRANYCRLEGLTISAGTTATGAIQIGNAAENVLHNHVTRCILEGADGTAAGRVGILFVNGTATYYNSVERCSIRKFYDAVVHGSACNANWYIGNRIEYYYRYGLDFGDSDENQILGGFFSQAPGRNAGDLTYSVHVGAGGNYNGGFYGSEAGGFSCALDCDGASNLFIINANNPYGPDLVAGNGAWQMSYGWQTRRGPCAIGDDAALAPLRITERSAAPTTPTAGDIYLDDGTNTGHGLPAFRRWTGAAWEDIGGAT